MRAKYFIFLLVLIAVALRLYRITVNEFLFYDEGMYLGQNRLLLNLVAVNPPHDAHEFFIVLGLMFKTALGMPKALWFFLLSLRGFWGGAEEWYFARLISAVAGLATVGLTYIWAKRYFRSQPIALLSALILLVLPSHVFYSRLGMQEALSTFLFLSGLYFYVFAGRGPGWRLFLSAVFLAAVYFTNYRMIVAPAFIVFVQLFQDWQAKQKPDLSKMAWFAVIFAAFVFGIGALYGGINTYVNFSWMAHQADDMQAHRHLVNFLSFPYYLFALDGILFGLCFWAGGYAAFKDKSRAALPFLLALLQMSLFSFAGEKGARYLCVVLPFAAMAAAYAVVKLREGRHAKIIDALVVCMFVGLLWHSWTLATARTAYQQAVDAVLAHDPQAKIISTQPLVESLFVADARRIVACPPDGASMAELMRQGYRYLIVDPQVYISWTAGGERFVPPLKDFLESIRRQVPPAAVLPHLNKALLQRFVLDHNQDLLSSWKFLRAAGASGQIYIYDLK